MAANRVIGLNNRLPWRLPADLKRFKAITMGKPMIMGRNTWESLPGLLPGRRHIVLTNQADYQAAGCEIAHSLDGALKLADDAAEVMIVGGGDIYRQALPLAQRIYLTRLELEPEGDAWFPELDMAEWREVSSESHRSDTQPAFDYRFILLERVSVGR